MDRKPASVNIVCFLAKQVEELGIDHGNLQNSLDAKDPDLPAATPVIVEFSLLNIPLNEIPGADRLYTVIDLCPSFFTKGDDGEKLKEWKKHAAKYLKDNESIPILKISDYNTTGLDGVHKLRDTSWAALVRQKGTTNKSNGQGGSHGQSKLLIIKNQGF